VPLAESVRQRAAYQALAKEFNNANIINTNQPIEQVINNVLTTVLEFMENRTYQRLHLTSATKGSKQGLNLCKP
jgi:hypothetical protein